MRPSAWRRVPLLMLAAGILGSCGEAPGVETYELSGYVTVLLETGDRGGPVEGARVVFTSDTRYTEEATTAGDGRYRMRVATDHPFGQVRAEAAGFRAHEETVYFDAAQRRVDLALRRAPSGDD